MIEELIRAKPSAAKGRYLRTVTIASTMGPGIKVDPSRTRDILGRRAVRPPLPRRSHAHLRGRPETAGARIADRVGKPGRGGP